MPLFVKIFERLRDLRTRALLRNDLGNVIPLGLLLILTGTIAYSLLEGWSLVDALYATIITITTVGYGDLTPESTGGRVFAIFFTLVAIGIGGYAISTLAAYVIERQSNRLQDRLRKYRMSKIAQLDQHIILCGADNIGRRIAKEFYTLHIPFVIIDPDAENLKRTLRYLDEEYYQQMLASFMEFKEFIVDESLSLEELADKVKVPFIQENPMDDTAIVQAGIARARGLVTALDDDRSNLAVVVGARALAQRFGNETVRIMTRIEDERFVRKMYLAGVDNVRIPAVLGGHLIAAHTVNPELGNWWYQMNTERGQRFYDVQLMQRPAWIGKTVAQVHREFKQMVIAVKRNDTFTSPPDPDLTLQPDDTAILLGSGWDGTNPPNGDT